MKKAYSLVFVALALTLSIFSSDSSASIPPEGWPSFTNTVQMGINQYNNGGVTLTAKNIGGDFSFALTPGGERYDIKNGSFKLTANFDSGFHFVSGKVAIDGVIWPDELPAPPKGFKTNLYSADLGEADINLAGSNPTFGFRTLLSTVGGWAAQFQHYDESVYLSGFSPDPSHNPLGFMMSLVQGKVTGTAITTVPVPAAFWLLGSSLLAVFGARRRLTSSAA